MALTDPDVDKELAAQILDDIARFEALVARKGADPNKIALRALELGMALGAPVAQLYFDRRDKEVNRGRDIAKAKAEAHAKKTELLFAEIDKRLASKLNNSAIALALKPKFGTDSRRKERTPDEYGRWDMRALRGHVAARRAKLQSK